MLGTGWGWVTRSLERGWLTGGIQGSRIRRKTSRVLGHLVPEPIYLLKEVKEYLNSKQRTRISLLRLNSSISDCERLETRLSST